MNNILHLLQTESVYKNNIYGRNVGVAILDTGISPHIDFLSDKNRIITFVDFVNKRKTIYDDCGHGTHVAGIIAGNGKDSDGLYHGIAPECNLIIIKILDHNGNGKVSNVLKGIRWVINNKDQYNIRLLNISIGSVSNNSRDNNSLIYAVDEAWNHGITVLTAAGNLGPAPHTVTIPGTSKKIITVGTSEKEMHSIDKGVSKFSYSGCGPTSECVLKPEIVAPGCNITSCLNSTNGYIKKSGTSMSTPIVTGAIALMYEKYPDMTSKEIKYRLYETAKDIGLPKSKQGWGLINIPALLDL